MLYPIILKRILTNLKLSYEDIILTKINCRGYKEQEAWLNKYFELPESDKLNIIKKFERSQTASIVNAMQNGDREIFINQMGVFYIKQTTIDFYTSLNKNIKEDRSNYEEVKQNALNECRSLFIQRANNKQNANNAIEIKIKK